MSRIARRLLPAAALAALSLAAPPQDRPPETLETALLDILLEQGVIDADQYERLLLLARERVNAHDSEIHMIEASLQRLAAPDVQARGGTPGKLQFKSSDGRWSLGLRGQIQARIEDFDSDDDTRDGTDISVPRARLSAEGNVLSRDLHYNLTLDMPTNKRLVDPASEPQVNVRNAYVDMGLTDGPGAYWRLGQFKFPYGRDMMTGSANLSFQERSIASEEFSPNFEPGFMAYGTLAEGAFEWYAAMSNGEGRSKNNTPGDEKNGLRKGLRAAWNPLGPVKLEGPAFQTLADGSTRLALAANWMVNEDSTGLATVTPDGEAVNRGFDLALYSGPFSLLAEHYARDSHVDGGADTDDSGYGVQAGWFFIDDTWELVARHSAIDYGAKDDAEERTLGVNWYQLGHSAKWQIDWSQLDNEGSTPDARRVRVQYQVLF